MRYARSTNGRLESLVDSLFDTSGPCPRCGRDTDEDGCSWCKTTGGFSAAADAAMEASLSASDATWRREIKTALLSYRASGQEFCTADALATVRAKGIETRDARALGAMIKSLARSGYVTKVGVGQSSMAGHHSGYVTMWRWVK